MEDLKNQILQQVYNNFNLEAKTFVTFDMAGAERKKFIKNAQEAMERFGFEFNLPDEDFDEFNVE